MKNISLKESSSITTTILTALGAGYAGLAQIWGFPYADQIVSSIAVIVSLISAVLGAFTMKKVSDRGGVEDITEPDTPSDEPTPEPEGTAQTGESEVTENV